MLRRTCEDAEQALRNSTDALFTARCDGAGMRRHHLATWSVLLLLPATLSACSGPTGDTTAAPTGTPVARAGDEPADGAQQGGPLDEYTGVGDDALEAPGEGAQREYEEAIARCMAADGFEYVPFVSRMDASFRADGTMTLDPDKGTFPDLPPAEFAAQFGYGISTRPAGTGKDEVDPNDAIVAQMSVAERVAYHRALYGPDNRLDDQGHLAGTGIMSSDESCVGRADAGAMTVEEQSSVARRVQRVHDSFASLIRRIQELQRDQLEDPRTVAATRAWAACLDSAGHRGFTALDQPRARALADARRVLGRNLDSTEADPARLASLRAAELRLAVADETCLRGWRTAHRAVRRDLESTFVQDNRQELEAFRSAVSAAVAERD